jgi:hypothetical protein
VESLAGSKLIKVQGERWLRIHRLKRVGALEVNRDVSINLFPLMNVRFDVDPFGPLLPPNLAVRAQNLHPFRRDLDIQPRYSTVGEEYLRLVSLRLIRGLPEGSEYEDCEEGKIAHDRSSCVDR